MMDWYYSKQGTQQGPVSLADLQAKIAVGEVSGADMAWCEGMADWQPVSSLAPLTPVTVSSAATPPAVPTVDASPVSPPLPAAKTSGLAVASLVCGVLGIFGSMICLVPGVVGIGGVICGHMGLAEIKRSNPPMDGRGMAIAGLITGYLSLLLIVVFFLVIVVTASMRNMQVKKRVIYDRQPVTTPQRVF